MVVSTGAIYHLRLSKMTSRVVFRSYVENNVTVSLPTGRQA
jgi:hypothetical protein